MNGLVWSILGSSATIFIFNIYVLIMAEIGHEHLTPSEVN